MSEQEKVVKEISEKIKEFSLPEKACQYLLFSLREESNYLTIYEISQLMDDIWHELE
jgi:hypothetical protein